MARPKKNITVSKEALLSQPMALSLLPYNYNASKNQLKLINAIVRKLQVLIKTSIAHKRSTGLPVDMRTFFDSAYNSRVLREEVLHKDDYVFDLHLSEFGVEPKRYPELYNELFKLGSIQAMLPFETELGDRGVRPVNLFIPIFWESRGQKQEVADKDGKKVTVYKYDRKRPEITIAIPRAMAEQVFNLNGWIDHYLDYVVTNIDSGYSGRLYIYLSSKKKNSKVDVTVIEQYQTFREIMGFIGTEKDKYPYYSDFRKRVLESSRKELKAKAEAGECDLWFDYQPVYTETSGRTPVSITFTIHLSALGLDNAASRELRHLQATIEEYLRTTLDQSPSQASELTRSKYADALNADELQSLRTEAERVAKYIEDEKPTFRTTKRSYVNAILTKHLTTVILPAREDTAAPTSFSSENAESAKSEYKNQPQNPNPEPTPRPNRGGAGGGAAPSISAPDSRAIYEAVRALQQTLTPEDYEHWAQPVISQQTPLSGNAITVRYHGPYYRQKRARQQPAFLAVLQAIRTATAGRIQDITAIHCDTSRETTL